MPATGRHLASVFTRLELPRRAALHSGKVQTMPTDDKKSTTKKTASSQAKPGASKAKPEAPKKVHKAGKPSNSFLAENPAPRMRGNRK